MSGEIGDCLRLGLPVIHYFAWWFWEFVESCWEVVQVDPAMNLVIHGDPVQAALRAVLFLGGGSGQRESSAHESLEVWQERPGAGQRKEIPRDSNPPRGLYWLIRLQGYLHSTINGRHAHSFLTVFCLEWQMNHAMPTQVEVWLGWHIYWIVTQLAPGKLNENRNEISCGPSWK